MGAGSILVRMSVLQSIFQDNTGKYVIGQPPNVPLILIGLSYILQWFIKSGPIHNVIAGVGQGAVFLWAYLEIRYGESPFRRRTHH